MNDLPASCPWTSFQASTFPTCEESLCSWVRQPGNTLSNLVFLFVALYLLRRHRRQGHPLDQSVGWCALLIGACSSIAHASSTRFFGFFDFGAIFSMACVIAVYNLKTYHGKRFRSDWLPFGGLFLASLTALYILESFKPEFLLLIIFFLLGWEYQILGRLGRPRYTLHSMGILISLTVGGAALILDSSGLICDPTAHFTQLHMVWHLMMALNIYFIATHLSRSRSL